MKFGSAASTTALESDGLFDHRPALGAPHNLPEPRHVDVARTILRNPAGPGWSAWLLRRTRRCRLLGTIPIVILVAAEAVFSVTHASSSIVAGIVCERKAVSKLAPTPLAPFFSAWYVASHVAGEAEHERLKAPYSRVFQLLTGKQV